MSGSRHRNERPGQLNIFTETRVAYAAPVELSARAFVEGSTVPRDYQKRIAVSALRRSDSGDPVSTLVVLPTSAGKTLIAIMAADHKLPEGRVIFVAHTGPLVRQQAGEFKMHLDMPEGQIVTVIGDQTSPMQRLKIYDGNPSIIVGTSQVISRDIERGALQLAGTSLFILDESHYAVKKHSHNYVAQAAREEGIPILATTASPGDNYERIMTVIENLGINNVEIYSRGSKDISKYMPPVRYVTKEVELPPIFGHIRGRIMELSGSVLRELGKDGMLIPLGIDAGKFANGALSEGQIAKLMRFANLEKLKDYILDYRKDNGNSPAGTPYFMLSDAEKKAAHALSLHAELMFYYQLANVFETQSIATGVKWIENIILAPKAGDKTFKARIRANVKFMKMYKYLRDNADEIDEHPKMQLFKDTLAQYPDTRFIVFTKLRDQAALLKTVAESVGVSASLLTGKRSGSTTGKAQQKAIDDFTQGKTRLLISTSAGREGLDISEAGVINYDQESTAIASIQRKGRTGRNTEGLVVDFVTIGTADEFASYRAARARRIMETALANIKTDFEMAKRE